MQLKYTSVRKVHEPTRGHATDAGIDFYMPELSKKDLDELVSKFYLHKSGKGFFIPLSSNVCIPSGIKVEIPYGYMGLFLNKSGMASKNSLVIGAQVIDTFYSGEIHIDLHNIGFEEIKIEPGQKLAQMVMVPILSCDLVKVEENQLYDWMKEKKLRGENGFGSTGK